MDATPGTDLTGKVIVVTGATGGIGKEIARALFRRGATVVIGGRDPGRTRAVWMELENLPENRVRDGYQIHAFQIDVAHQASLHAFTAAVRDRFDAIDGLVNNAGAWFTDRRESRDGVELTLATNVLGPHKLSELLTPLLQAGARARGEARVVNIVSGIAGNYDATDLQFTRRPYDGFRAYAQSKAALRMLTWGLAARLEGTGVTANAAAPGFVRTGFNRNARGLRAGMINFMARLMAASPEKGAATPVWVTTAPELAGVTGRYFDGQKAKDGGFADPAAIADLERRCQELERAGRA
jgi:NAD(P)-dependent dehydrogenase (short-subunit alcohol dehydrogenase family)